MKKNIVTLLVALLATASGARADDGVWVERLDGTKLGFLFVDEPKITCDADILVLKTSSATVEFPIAELKRLYFSDDIVTGVGAANAGITSEIIRATRNGAELSGFAAGTPVTVYNLSGKSLRQLNVEQDGTLTVNLSTLPQGTYIIKAKKSTLKIQTK